MPISDLHRPIDALIADRNKLQRLFLVLGGALFLAYFLPWGIPGLGARWEMDFFVDIWPFLWGFAFAAVGAAQLLKLPFSPRPFGMGVALFTFAGIGLVVVSLKLAGDVSGVMNAFFLGTQPFLVTGALGHLGLFTILGALYLVARRPDLSWARYASAAGGGLLFIGMLLPGKSSGDAFPIAALFRMTSGLGVLYSLFALACLVATLGLSISPFVPKDKLPPMVKSLAVLMLLSLLPLGWLLFWILGGSGAWQDIYSVPHRILTLGGLLVSLFLGAELVVKALGSSAHDRFTLFRMTEAHEMSERETAPGHHSDHRDVPPHHHTSPAFHGNAQGHAQPHPGEAQPRRGYDQHIGLATTSEADSASPCPVCGAQLEWVAEYERWYCRRCSQYL